MVSYHVSKQNYYNSYDTEEVLRKLRRPPLSLLTLDSRIFSK